MNLKTQITEIHYNKDADGMLFSILKFASVFYGIGSGLKNFLYDKHILTPKKVGAFVLSVGNLTTGGVGKTPVVAEIAKYFIKKGETVAIISRGYGGELSNKNVNVISDGKKIYANARLAGDEPFMMSRVLSQYKVPIVICPDRAEAANEALRRFKSQIILLDDGLQHHRLRRDANIILVDAKNPFGNKELLPYGILREPMSALKRASLVVLTHCDQVSERQLEDIRDEVRLHNDSVEILESVHEPEYFFDICHTQKVDLGAIKGPAACFCALGHPETFEKTLENLGLELKQKWRFPDHQFYTEQNLRTFEETRGNLPLITTFKDFVKFPDNWREILTKDVYVLSVNLKIRGGEKEFYKFTDVLYPKFSKIRGK